MTLAIPLEPVAFEGLGSNLGGGKVTRLFIVLAMLMGAAATLEAGALAPVKINEVRIDQPGTDNDEYFELIGPAGTPLDGLTYIVIGDGTGGSGVIEAVVDLTGSVIPADGLFVAAEATFTLGAPDLVTSLNFENSDNVTHLLVDGFIGADGDDLDLDDDCILDVTPWTAIVDGVAFIEEPNPPTSTACAYPSATVEAVGPDGTFVPGLVLRCPDGTGSFEIGAFTLGLTDTPGALNDCTLTGVEICDDGIDNDGDGFIYCDYFTCIGDPSCRAEICDDGIDNDGDGFVDCDDFDCGGDPACPDSEICDDGIDNDGNGFTDCEDFACTGDPACPGEICDDGVDNDGDGFIDCDDFDCGGDPACPDSEICDDGIDNDGNGFTDCEDFACNGDPACPDEICDDGIDNDGDGFTDCDDFDCDGDPACPSEICDDGIDNDGDGFIDCDDFDCDSDPACPSEICDDGIDNDGDGFIDCEDFDCGGDPACLVEICDDGIDNDGDGFTDCEDLDCDGDPACVSGDQFQRGDANGDGSKNIGDAVFILNFLFVPGSPAPSCDDGADVNDDGSVNIGDAVFELNFLFVPGSPGIPEPCASGCGVDPTSDALDCPGGQPSCP